MQSLPTPPSPTPAGGKTMSRSLQMVAQHMARLQVAGAPRNYELFHEALFGHNAALAREVSALSANPGQPTLDDIGLRHRLISHCGIATERTQTESNRLLRGLNAQLSSTLTQKRTLINALETIGRSLRADGGQSLADGLAELDYLAASINELLMVESDISRSIAAGIEKLEALERGVASAEATLLRDRLTGLPNRIAFTNRLAGVYEADDETKGTALILIDIDRFAAFNEKFGEATGNRMLKRLATIFRKSIKKNDFVARTGGDEFAFLFTDVSFDASRAIAERLRSSVEDNIVFATSEAADPGALSISIGVAFTDDARSAAQLRGHAEAALAAARSNPRSPVMLYSPQSTRASAAGGAFKAV